jgi:DNA-binding NtrC family response regulator
MLTVKDQKTVLLASVDSQLKSGVHHLTGFKGYRILDANTSSEILSILEKELIDVVILDIENMPAQEMDLVNYVRTRSSHTDIIILATMNELDQATHAMRSGAALYLIKPIEPSDIGIALGKLTKRQDELREHIELEQRVLADLMSGSPAMQKVFKLALKIAPTSSTILIGGESGTGKEFFARIIHRMSRRPEGQFVAMNCGAVPDTLFESELFGHKKGAFTSADSDRPGLVEEAHLGTLFLDEVGELSPSAQVKLLRFLQERTFRRIGENVLRTVNVRIIAASNQDLVTLIQAKRFREDLYYRLNVFNLYLPPLRERKETIPNLISLFVHRYNDLHGKQVTRFSKAAEALLASYSYPGNVRELENIIEHAVALSDGEEITEKELPEALFRNRLLLSAPTSAQSPSDIVSLSELEKEHIRLALSVLNYNYSETAKRLGVSRSTLWRKIKDYGLETK